MIRKTLNGLFQLGITVAIVMLLFVIYQAWITDIFADQRQDQVAQDLHDSWEDGPDALPAEPDFGTAFAFLHAPRLGADWQEAVLQGTDEETLKSGPGHYTDTAMPGEVGNFAVAGHRVGTGAPFLDIDELQDGDPVIVETQDTWYIYRVVSNEIVSPDDAAVIYPVPDGTPEETPTQAYLTLTTCHPEFSAKQRLIVHALLDTTVPKSESPLEPSVT